MARLRSAFQQKRYDEYRQGHEFQNTCVLCAREPIHVFRLWKIVTNEFPYDVIASVHHMIVPLRHVKEEDLTDEECAEYKEIMNSYANQNYQFIIEPTNKMKTIPGHHHMHLIVIKERSD